MSERIVLDPSEVSTGRTELDITAWSKAEGIDWGDGEIAAYMADQQRGSSPIDFRIPNRLITIPLSIRQVAGSSTTFSQARILLQAKVARIQQEGGWVKRQFTNSTILFADVVNSSVKFGGGWYSANRNFDLDAELHLEAIPDWYGAEVTLADHVDTTNGDLIWTESNILGNYPGRLRLVVDNDQPGVPQMGLLWGIRSRHYSNSTTAQLAYSAAQLTPLDSATLSGGTSINHQNLSTSWTPVCSTDQAGVALTHTGTYRVWVRVTTPLPVVGATPSRVRLVWDVGDFALPTENNPAQIPGFGQSYLVDLGEVRLDRVPAGTHRWRGVLQASGPAGGETVGVTRIWFVPVDEGYGALRAPSNFDPGLQSYSARDEFNQSAGALAGKNAPVGGFWVGSGDTDDFVVDAGGHWAMRTATGDTGSFTGRYAISGAAAMADQAVTLSCAFIKTGVGGPGMWGAAIARYIDTNNWLMLALRPGFVTTQQIALYKSVAGIRTGLTFQTSPTGSLSVAGSWYSIMLTVDTVGQWNIWVVPLGSRWGDSLATGRDNDLATGGALASGKPGFYDVNSGTFPAATRYYDGFAAWVPPQDAVLHPNQSAELRTEGMFREEATGAAFGPVSHVVGDLPRIPPSGAEGRTAQFFLKASRGDLDKLPDTGVDDISARVTYRPSYLFVS